MEKEKGGVDTYNLGFIQKEQIPQSIQKQQDHLESIKKRIDELMIIEVAVNKVIM